MFLRNKQHSTKGKRNQGDKPSAHELFLELEGFLPPSHSCPKKRSTAPSSRTSSSCPSAVEEKSKLSQELSVNLPRDAKARHDNQPNEKRPSSRRKRGIFALNAPVPREDSAHPPPRSSPSCAPKDDTHGRSLTSGWFRRCISTAFKEHPSPPPSFTTLPAYHGLSMYQDDDITALPTLPGYEKEVPRIPDMVLSGAKGRATDVIPVVQGEVSGGMRDLQISAMTCSGDRESGVGIELQDHGEVTADFEIPIIRRSKGRLSDLSIS